MYGVRTLTGAIFCGLLAAPPSASAQTLTAPSLTTLHGEAARAANRVDMVVLGDGYTHGELATRYRADTQSLVDTFFGTGHGSLSQPFSRYRRFFNVHEIAVASNESGLDRPEQGIDRDTAFNGRLIGRLATFDRNLGNQAIANAVAGTDIDVDTRFGLLNSSAYGGAGVTGGSTSAAWGFATGSNNATPEVTRHEIGHSFAGLADEYTYGGNETYTGSEPNAPNVSTDPTGAKWSEWLGYTDELGVIGAYEGGLYAKYGIYRPTQDSKMRTLDQPFNAVSREQIVGAIYDHVDPLDQYSDNTQVIHHFDDELPVKLMAQVVDPTVIKLDWSVGGQSLGSGSETLDLGGLGLADGHQAVRLRAYDEVLDHAYSGDPNLDWVRRPEVAQKLEQRVSWEVYTGVAAALRPLIEDRLSARDGDQSLTLDLGGALVIGDHRNGVDYALTELRFGSHDADSQFELTDTIDLAGQTLTVDVLNNSATDRDAALLSGALTGGGTLIKTGDGELRLSGPANQLGGMRVHGGTVAFTDDATMDGDSTIVVDGGDLRINSDHGIGADLELRSGRLSGSGTIASAVTVGQDTALAPGNSPGAQSYTGGLGFMNGGSYLWEINDFNGSAGSDPGWDTIDVSGGWDIDGLDPGGFDIAVASLTAANDPGLAAGFDPFIDYRFDLLTFDTLIGSFSTDLFNLDLSGFLNSDNGHWSLELIGNALTLHYDSLAAPPAIGAPTTAWLLALGLGLGLAQGRRPQA